MAKFDNDPENDFLDGPRNARLPRCKAAKTDGTRCGGIAMRGQSCCRVHGGKIKQNLNAAERRQKQEKAQELLRQHESWNFENPQPVTDPVEELALLAGQIREFREVIGRRLEDDSCVCCGGPDMSSVTAHAMRDLTRDFAKILTDLGRLGIEDRRVRILNRQADIAIAGLIAGLAAAGISEHSDEQRMILARGAALQQMRELEAQPLP